jgi:hypothetical protein
LDCKAKIGVNLHVFMAILRRVPKIAKLTLVFALGADVVGRMYAVHSPVMSG